MVLNLTEREVRQEKDCVLLQNASAFFDLLPLLKCSIWERIRTPSQVEEP
jgi:hypothetical protein